MEKRLVVFLLVLIGIGVFFYFVARFLSPEELWVFIITGTIYGTIGLGLIGLVVAFTDTNKKKQNNEVTAVSNKTASGFNNRKLQFRILSILMSIIVFLLILSIFIK